MMRPYTQADRQRIGKETEDYVRCLASAVEAYGESFDLKNSRYAIEVKSANYIIHSKGSRNRDCGRFVFGRIAHQAFYEGAKELSLEPIYVFVLRIDDTKLIRVSEWSEVDRLFNRRKKAHHKKDWKTLGIGWIRIFGTAKYPASFFTPQTPSSESSA